ncbi:MAG: TRAM domain-containing protein [Phycisphaerales bacterium]|nr:TRAM domain-containing protein [Phycisphaerales bacterium]
MLALGVIAITFVVGQSESGLGGFALYADVFLVACMGFGLVVISLDIFIPQKSLKAISGVFFGLLIGIVIAFGLSLVVDLSVEALSREYPNLRSRVYANVPVEEKVTELDENGLPRQVPVAVMKSRPIGYTDHPLISTIKLIIGVICCYLSISFILQTRDDVRFMIPYVEFSRQARGGRPLILDTSVIIDGRIADIADTRVFESEFIVPKFVLGELHAVADSSDKLKRNRGRRGLDVLNTLQAGKNIDIKIKDVRLEPGGATRVDERLVELAQRLNGRIVTNDYNLNQVAQFHGVDVININDLANALKPVYLPGERFRIKVVKPGEDAGQGIGYLDDGTMVVVNGGRGFIGQAVDVAVTSSLQTSAGRMIFGRVDTPGEAPGGDRPRPAQSSNA